jgi:two-component system, LuxR family, response regulator FixJ
MKAQDTVFVIDDDVAARESVMALVSLRGMQVAGFASAEEFLAHYDPLQKGCIVVDVRIPGMSGLELLEELRRRKCLLPVVMITGYGDVPMAVRAMQAGAITFLEKPCQEHELWQGINQALEIEQTQHAVRKQRVEIEGRLTTLTEEEMSVLRRLLEGHPNKRIATDLNIGLRTVELRRANIMRKMQAASLPELVRMAILVDILKPEGPPAAR